MPRYRVIGKTTCYACTPQRTKIVDDPEIEAADERAAAKEFERKHRLCPECLARGTKATVEFDPLINVEDVAGP